MYCRAYRGSVILVCSPLLPERQIAIAMETLRGFGDFQARKRKISKTKEILALSHYMNYKICIVYINLYSIKMVYGIGFSMYTFFLPWAILLSFR